MAIDSGRDVDLGPDHRATTGARSAKDETVALAPLGRHTVRIMRHTVLAVLVLGGGCLYVEDPHVMTPAAVETAPQNPLETIECLRRHAKATALACNTTTPAAVPVPRDEVQRALPAAARARRRAVGNSAIGTSTSNGNSSSGSRDGLPPSSPAPLLHHCGGNYSVVCHYHVGRCVSQPAVCGRTQALPRKRLSRRLPCWLTHSHLCTHAGL